MHMFRLQAIVVLGDNPCTNGTTGVYEPEKSCGPLLCRISEQKETTGVRRIGRVAARAVLLESRRQFCLGAECIQVCATKPGPRKLVVV